MVDVVTGLLILAAVAVGLLVGYLVGNAVTSKSKELQFAPRLKEARQDSVEKSRSSLTGQFLEKLAPHFRDFPFDPTEVRFIGTPIDYLVFQGLSSGTVERIVFLEVKSGKSSLTSDQRRVRDAVEAKKVDWHVYRAPE